MGYLIVSFKDTNMENLMIQLTEYVKYGTAYDKLDGWIYGISLGQEYGGILSSTAIVVYVEIYLKNCGVSVLDSWIRPY